MNLIINEEVEKLFCLTFRRLSPDSASYPNFSGIGLILYDSKRFDQKWRTDLRPSILCPKDVNLSDIEKTIAFLLKISDKSNRLHDGFHFFDHETGLMTHVAQYFFPPIISGTNVNESYGTRYHSAQYGSCIDGVVLTGTINSDGRHYIFRKGKLIASEE